MHQGWDMFALTDISTCPPPLAHLIQWEPTRVEGNKGIHIRPFLYGILQDALITKDHHLRCIFHTHIYIQKEEEEVIMVGRRRKRRS